MNIDRQIRLTALASCAGCAAKMRAGSLAQILSPLKHARTEPIKGLLVGLSIADDAAVYRVNERQAVISTADFFPPVVDDPYAFGAIAAANAGCIPRGAERNKSHLATHTRITERLGAVERAILWDPQTSGRLFAAIAPALWPELRQLDPAVQFRHIGEVTEQIKDETGVILEVY